MNTIPFNHPYIERIEAESVSLGFKIGQLPRDGVSTIECSELLEKKLGNPRMLLSPFYTHVLTWLPFFVDQAEFQLATIISTIQKYRPGSSQ